jgi:hypothetical protein
MKSNLEINNEVKILQKENEELKTRLSINSKIIQEFFKNSNINDKISLFVENIKKENNLLLSENKNLKLQNQKLLSENEKISNPNKINIDDYENKLFVYENLLKEKQSIIINLKEQNKNLKLFIDSKIKKNEINNNEEIVKDNKINYKYIIEEIYVISPQQLINTLNDKIELYKDINIKLKNLIQEMKSRIVNKDKEYLKLEEELMNLRQELQKYTQMKNNEEIMNQLIQYQSMKSIPTSQSCSNINFNIHQKYLLKNKNKKNKQTRSLSYINNYTNDLKKVMKEIEVYENVNKTVKEISKNDFDLAGEWSETLKQCGMTQEEFLRFCGMKVTSKLTNAIEYLYKILIDKNIQIKLLMKENDTLNEENIRLNKINIHMESMVNYYEKNNKNSKDDNNDINIHENTINKNHNKKNKIIKSNTFFDDDKMKNKKIFNSSSKNNKQKTYVNVDNNITHTNININMMMDIENKKDINKNCNTFSDYINKSSGKLKLKDRKFKKIKLNNKKINNNSYNKLIKEKKNGLVSKTLNLSAIKKFPNYVRKNNNDSFNYNKAIKNIFSNTEKILLKKKERNTVTKKNFNLIINSLIDSQ